MAHDVSIEVFDGELPASTWQYAHGDDLIEAALLHGLGEWRWHQLPWGVVLELTFADEEAWERFRGRGRLPGRHGRRARPGERPARVPRLRRLERHRRAPRPPPDAGRRRGRAPAADRRHRRRPRRARRPACWPSASPPPAPSTPAAAVRPRPFVVVGVPLRRLGALGGGGTSRGACSSRRRWVRRGPSAGRGGSRTSRVGRGTRGGCSAGRVRSPLWRSRPARSWSSAPRRGSRSRPW